MLTTALIPVDQLLPNQNNPFPPLPADKYADLLESIKRNGVLQSLLVVPDGKKYRVMSGHNRLRAAKELCFTVLRCDVLPKTKGLIAYDTELFRRHLGEVEYEKQKAAIRAYTDEWYEERCEADLEPELYDKFKAGEMSRTEAVRLMTLSREQQRDLIRTLKVVEKVEVRASGSASLKAEIERIQQELDAANERETQMREKVDELAEKERKAKGIVQELREQRDEAARQLEAAKAREAAALKGGANKALAQAHAKELEESRQRLVDMSRATAEAKKEAEKIQEQVFTANRQVNKLEAENKAMATKLRTVQEATVGVIRLLKNPDGILKRYAFVASELTAIRETLYQYLWPAEDVARFERQAAEIGGLLAEVVAAAKAQVEQDAKAA